ncbi:hypothetical protein SAMN04488554_0533 [Ruania alba]|uniref:Uncharacterized protein n=1 Tax=Ruania alba TaxID=648782 RepID=A0A1H5D0L1_9MICO|nr:hypothetical protein SAMN04488554_0533 [Ruania alba]
MGPGQPSVGQAEPRFCSPPDDDRFRPEGSDPPEIGSGDDGEMVAGEGRHAASVHRRRRAPLRVPGVLWTKEHRWSPVHDAVLGMSGLGRVVGCA